MKTKMIVIIMIFIISTCAIGYCLVSLRRYKKGEEEISNTVKQYLEWIMQGSEEELANVCEPKSLAVHILWTKNNYENLQKEKSIAYSNINYEYEVKKIETIDSTHYKVLFDYSLSVLRNHGISNQLFYYDNIMWLENHNNTWMITNYQEKP